MKKNALADHRALQAWFNRRVVNILEKHQRKMIGWDEIQHPDLPKNIVIQSWQGPDAVSPGKVKNSPTPGAMDIRMAAAPPSSVPVAVT